MKLIYRSQVFESHPQAIKSYTKPNAINWRYAVAGENYPQKSYQSKQYSLPKAINWRWLPPV